MEHSNTAWDRLYMILKKSLLLQEGLRIMLYAVWMV